MIKLIGCGILFFSIFQIGQRKVEKLKFSNLLLFDLWYAIREIGRQIDLTQAPLSEIYRLLAKEGQGKTDFFCKLYALGDFQKAYLYFEKQIKFPGEIDIPMRKFFHLLGKTEAEVQKKLCADTADTLYRTLCDAKENFAGMRKMYLTTAACIGGMLVLFML